MTRNKIFGRALVWLVLSLTVDTSLLAQTIEIGTGTAESSNYSASPVNIYYRRSVSEFIYTAAELQAAGASSTEPINAIGWYVTQAPIFSIPGYRIQLKHTTQSDVSTPVGGGGWTTIVNPTTYTPTAGGFDMITTNGNFTWDGTSNIAVRVCWSRVNPNWNASGKVRITPTANGYIYTWTDNNGNSCGNTAATVTTTKPHVSMRFHPADTTVWTGNVSTDWFTDNNWTYGVPTKFMSAYIPAGVSNMPLISGSNAVCKNLHVEATASLSFGGSEEINVFGNWTNLGTFSAATSMVNFLGLNDAPVNITLGGAHTFHSTTIASGGTTTLSSGLMQIQGSMNFIGGDFLTNNNLRILSNAIGTGRIPEIKNRCAYSIDMFDTFGDGWNEGFVSIQVDGQNTGSFAASGAGSSAQFYVNDGSSISIDYTAGIYEWENSYDILDENGSTIFSDGPTPSTGTVFTTTATCSFTDPLNGDIEMQRYVDAGATNWRFLTSAITGTDLEQFDDDFITSGIPGSDWPLWPNPINPWPSFYFYNEDLGITFEDGYYVPSSMNDVLGAGQGVWIWCGDTITGTQPFVVDFFGPANTGIINLPVDFNAASGNMNDDGWNMVGNPYPCTIDWDDPAWTKNNIEDAIYIWNPDIQQYASYVAGVGVNGGSNLIASSQAFLVHADASNPQLTVTEECKEDADAPFIRASNISTDLLRLEISDGSYWDETVIRFDPNLTNHFDKYADAYKKQYQYPVGPSIMSLINGDSYSINTLYPDSLYFEIPIHVEHVNNGTHHIKALDINAINGYSCVVLEDKLTGAVMNLHTDSIYTYTGNVNELPNRFVIKFSIDARISSNDISCNDEVDGEIHLEGFFPGSIIEIISDSLFSNSTVPSSYHIIDSLYSGNYTITITDPHGACPIVTEIENIDNPSMLSAYLNSNNASCAGCCDGMIEILPTGGSTPYTYELNGVSYNSTIINLCAGNYTVKITDANGCTYHDQVLLFDGITSIDDAESSYNVYPNPAFDVVNISANHTVSIKLFDATGRLVMSDDNKSTYVIDVSELASGSYFLLIDQTKKVLIIR